MSIASPQATAPAPELISKARAFAARQRRLDAQQLGHLRHIENLANRPDGDWSLMGAADPGQEWLDAYRYQLAKMAYALGLAHYHRLPAAPCAFQSTYQALVRKMLRRDVWGYWKETSQSGSFIDPGLAALRTPWIDPVVKENIMYSGHLHAMTGMYAMLFDDDRYAAPGALTFTHAPIFYGLGPQKFEYDFRSLNETIYWQMVESGWLGVACEPNCVFLICNQFPMLGFRFHDVRHGTAIADEATASYRQAWDKKGMLQADGHFHYFWRQRQDQFFDNGRPSADTWLGAVMNAWNSEFVHGLAPAQAADWFRRFDDGTVSLLAPGVVQANRAAKQAGAAQPPQDDLAYKFGAPEFGYAAIWASELGDAALLQGLLAHADAHMAPTWERGGLYYPREDRSWNDAGRLRYMDPLTGNALLGYARLNVANGLRTMFREPWRAPHFQQPALTAMAPVLDVLSADYGAAEQTLAFSVRPRADRPAPASLTVSRVPVQRRWLLLRNGQPVAGAGGFAADSGIAVHEEGDTLRIELLLPPEAIDLALSWE